MTERKDDIVERLRTHKPFGAGAIMDEAADDIERLRAALKPIAQISLWQDRYPDGPDIVTDDKLNFVTPDQIREARKLFGTEQRSGD